MDREKAGKEIVRYSKLMYARGYASASEGNISYRLTEKRVLITPSKIIKKFIKDPDLVEIDMEGGKTAGRKEPTTERYTHLEVYKNNPGARAVIHAHPFYAVLLTALGIDPFERLFLPEACMFLSRAAVAPYARPSTREGAEAIRPLCADKNVILLSRHGSLTYGADLAEAFSLLEIVEKYCKTLYFALQSGRAIQYLDESEVKGLSDISY